MWRAGKKVKQYARYFAPKVHQNVRGYWGVGPVLYGYTYKKTYLLHPISLLRTTSFFDAQHTPDAPTVQFHSLLPYRFTQLFSNSAKLYTEVVQPSCMWRSDWRLRAPKGQRSCIPNVVLPPHTSPTVSLSFFLIQRS